MSITARMRRTTKAGCSPCAAAMAVINAPVASLVFLSLRPLSARCCNNDHAADRENGSSAPEPLFFSGPECVAKAVAVCSTALRMLMLLILNPAVLADRYTTRAAEYLTEGLVDRRSKWG